MTPRRRAGSTRETGLVAVSTRKITVFPAIKQGDSGPKVKGIQVQLNVCKTPAPPAPFAPVPYPSVVKTNGEFDADMRKAVEFFQKHVGLKVDGEVGPKTLKMMFLAKKAKKAPSADKTGVKAKLSEKQKANIYNMQGKTADLKALQKWVAQTQKAVDTWAKMAAPQQSLVQKSGDDAQLAQLDLQSALQKQQQAMQLASNMSRKLHETAMAIIKKIG